MKHDIFIKNMYFIRYIFQYYTLLIYNAIKNARYIIQQLHIIII